MTDTIPEAIINRKSRFSLVWLIPFLALALGGWLTFKYLNEKGVVIQIEFSSASGLAAGKTKIKYKDVEIGVVDEITIGSKLTNVLVTATISNNMRTYLSKETKFWVIRARVAAGEISGLGTLLSGAYIGIEPGEASKKLKKKFRGLNKPPLLFTEDHGSQYQLHSKTLYSFENGAPIYYRRLKVGEVLSHKLNEQGTEFSVEVFIREPYNKLVHENTQFWNASGVDIKLGADGLELQTESLVSLLLGGIAFDNLSNEPGPIATSGTVYPFYKNRHTAANALRERGDVQYRVYFDGSARGLAVGAPVTLRGITVGNVIEVRLEYDLRDKAFKIPVTIEFVPDTFTIVGNGSEDAKPPTAVDLVEHGLRAQLRSGNLLTGQMLIDLDIYPDAEPVEITYEGDYMILPTVPTTIESLMQNLNSFLTKISAMPMDEIGINLNGVLEGVNTLVNSNDLTATLSNINQATAQLTKTLAQADTLATGLSEDSDAYQELLRTMRELSGAARSLRQMAEYLERHPEALLKGKP